MRFYSVTEQIKAGVSVEQVQYHHGHKNLGTILGYLRRAEKKAKKDERLETIYR